jgi:predicted phage baseplate assembly protein
MYRPAPKIDERSAQEISSLVGSRLAERMKWSRLDAPAEELMALIRIFARYGEIVIDRLNRAPEKNFLAYLNILGVSPVPPAAAKVPLTFKPVENGPAGVRVPAQTQVAAQAEEGETEPVVFETERPLELTTSTLKHVFTLDPLHDAETDLTGLAQAVGADGVTLFAAGRPSNHVLFLGHSLMFGLPYVTRLRLKFEIETGPPIAFGQPSLEWIALDPQAGVPVSSEGPDKLDLEAWMASNPRAGVPLTPSVDGTKGLIESGEVVFETLVPWSELNVRNRRSRWLACRLASSMRSDGFDGWLVRRVEFVAEVNRREVPLDVAFSEGSAVDLTKDFFPFTQRPVFGSTLYLASSEVLSHPGALVTLDIALTNPHGGTEEPPIPVVYVDGHPRVWWEYWNGVRWMRLSETDQTRAFRVNGLVSFRIPDDFSPTTVNGIENYWLRARLVSGNYGEEERWELIDPERPGLGMKRRPPTLAPPSIRSLTASYDLRIASDSPEFAITCNQLVYQDVTDQIRAGQGVTLFGFPCGSRPALYLGFDSTDRKNLVSRSLSLYLQVDDRKDRPFSRAGARRESDVLEWQFWDGLEWRRLDVSDETESLAFPGLVVFVVPEEIVARTDFVESSPLYWFRVISRSSGLTKLPRLRGILINTTLATHTLTLENEVLGSSDGTPYLRFYAARNPILKDVQLQVREAESAAEIAQILREVPDDAVEIRRDDSLRVQEVWVRWDEVRDFLGSDQDSRHYVVDRQSGEIDFGDGEHGRIPPRGSNNIRLRRYQTGGGAQGNKSPDKINQLRTAIPYVESATNLVEASGGFDLEEMDRVRARGARTVRHRSRAVTLEDYQDLAKLATPEVARAKCVPLRDLAADPDALRPKPGVVSLIIVPKTQEIKPSPSAALLRQVRSYLDRYRDLTTELVVVGPDYVRISVEAELVISAGGEAGRIAAEVNGRLQEFLHPLSGGSTQQGWRFAEVPHRSDFYGLCASIPGVDFISLLRVSRLEERSGAIAAGNFLIYSGTHNIRIRYESGRETPVGVT